MPTTGRSRRSAFPWSQYSLITFSTAPAAEFLENLSKQSAVSYIHPITAYKVYQRPNDSAYASQWNIERIRIKSLRENGTINHQLPGVIVGVIDTGIDDDHPDLKGMIALNSGEMGNGKEWNGIDDDGNGFTDDWRGYDFVDGESRDAGDWSVRDNDPDDENGHGTAVAGIISAQTGNGIGLSGISNAAILPLRAFGKNGSGSDIDIASAVIYAADNGADVINMSFGDVIRSPFLHDALRYAYSKDIVLVASSGNDGTEYPHYPSDFTEVISTGSVGLYNVRSFFSSRSSSLDIMAPGEQIITTTKGGGYTDQFAGTSAAAPHVSGVAAVIKGIQKLKKVIDPGYRTMTNEELRGILLNSADDAGPIGWDNDYASGIVNAEKALSVVMGSLVQIHSPELDRHITSGKIPVIVTAVSPYLEYVSLAYGIGDSPEQWVPLKSVANSTMVRDTMMLWDVTSLKSNIYQLRLTVKNSKGNDVESRQRIIIDASQPAIISFRFRDSVITDNDHTALVEARIDRISSASLFYRKKGENVYRTISAAGMQMNHSFVLGGREFLPNIPYEFYCVFTENSSEKRTVRFPSSSLVGFDHFEFSTDQNIIPNTGFVKKHYELPQGFLLNSVPVLQGKKHLILNEYDSESNFGRLKAYQFSGNSFILRDSSQRSWVPRSFVAGSSAGPPLILVQDRGTSQLLAVDTVTGVFFRTAIWGDSTDIWASQLSDLNGDALPEIIARNSSEYLVYRNLGNAQFTLAARLPNPTRPLDGEVKNQFGPPRSVVGDFSNSGRKEIIFADHDGDLISYRQTSSTSLDFTLAWVDSSDLIEMSDHIASGDFTGDGIPDIAVAGHTELGWNQDREYTVPVWTIKVFSRVSSDAPGTVRKIWEQNVLGVRSGSGYDNGLVSGKIRTTDSQEGLFVSLNPHLYLFEWNAVKKTFVTRWHHASFSNSVIIDDLDNDTYSEIGINIDGHTEFWSLQNSSAVQSPFGLTAVPENEMSVRLTWNSSVNDHRLYRGTHPDSLKLLTTVIGKTWLDMPLKPGTRYTYAVTAVNGTESELSERSSVVPHSVPTIIYAEQSSIDQIVVRLSYDVTSSALLSAGFELDPSSARIRSSSIVWRSERSVIVTFPGPIPAGNHSLRITSLTDESGMRADTNSVFAFTASITEDQKFFVSSISMLSQKRIALTFNSIPDAVTSRNISNYSVKTNARIFPVSSIDSVSERAVVLNIADGNPLNALALRIEVSLDRKIVSADGIPLNSGTGQVLSIAQESKDIDHIAVYPNPVRNTSMVSFVNLPSLCRITVYSPNGSKIKAFNELTGREGITWDLKDERGNIVSTGIYLYRVEQLGPSNDVLNTTLGKFAVIR